VANQFPETSQFVMMMKYTATYQNMNLQTTICQGE